MVWSQTLDFVPTFVGERFWVIMPPRQIGIYSPTTRISHRAQSNSNLRRTPSCNK